MKRFGRRALRGGVIAIALATAGCAKPAPRAVTFHWVFGGSEPTFDPSGPPDVRRWSLERLLTRGLLAEDSAARIVPDAAETFLVSDDSLVYTFRLRPKLAYVDGSPCGSEDFRRAMIAGLERRDHGTYAWILAAVRGVAAIRLGKPLPEIGIETPDPRTLILRLSRPDGLLLEKLAVPGVADAWKAPLGSDWKSCIGLGPYRVVAYEPGLRLRAIPAAAPAGPAVPGKPSEPDTLLVRFGYSPGRARAAMREGRAELIWPLPVGLLDEPLPARYHAQSRPARPRNELLLVMRADLPPTTRLATRRALAHGINQDDLMRRLGIRTRRTVWIMGGPEAEFPRLDPAEILMWMQRGKLGISFHVDMIYRGDGPGAAIARAMQEEWSRHGIYVEPRPLRGDRYVAAALGGLTHLALAESQALVDDPSAELAQEVMPLRGPPVGPFRTGWRTREFDAWIGPHPASAMFPVDLVARRLEEETVALPLAELDWVWVEPAPEHGVPVHPHFGPQGGVPGVTVRR